MVRGVLEQNWRRATNRLWDAVAAGAGYCMQTTWRSDQATYKPGFKHWRCWKRRGHPGPHRTGNYRWNTGGMPIWDPMPLNVLIDRPAGVAPKWLTAKHHQVGTRRRDRLHDRIVLERVRAGGMPVRLPVRPEDWGGWKSAKESAPIEEGEL